MKTLEQRVADLESKKITNKVTLVHPNNPNFSFVIELHENETITTKTVSRVITEEVKSTPFFTLEK